MDFLLEGILDGKDFELAMAFGLIALSAESAESMNSLLLAILGQEPAGRVRDEDAEEADD